jgi:exopolyphosphatase/pppGpp-phosphohydrolase
MHTLLEIGPEHTAIVIRDDAVAPVRLMLQLGTANVSRDHFRHTPPTPRELEDAIQAVEDEIGSIHSRITGASQLVTKDIAIRELARLAGASPNPTLSLSREAVEATFNRMVATSSNQPPGRDGLPTNADFTATLLILREFMHHLDFASITVLT